MVYLHKPQMMVLYSRAMVHFAQRRRSVYVKMISDVLTSTYGAECSVLRALLCDTLEGIDSQLDEQSPLLLLESLPKGNAILRSLGTQVITIHRSVGPAIQLSGSYSWLQRMD
jgi:hypothetical protein